MRIGGFLAEKHRHSRRFGWSVMAITSADSLGLVALHGNVVARDLQGLAGQAECRR
jgi:RNA-directed DNA polymerase